MKNTKIKFSLSRKNIYNWVIAFIAIFSILLIVLDYAAVINLNTTHSKWFWINNALLAILAVDYFWQLFRSKNKKEYVKNNIFELLSILPISLVFIWIRMTEVGFLIPIRFLRLIRLTGLMGRLRKIFHNSGFLYVIYFSLTFLLLGSIGIALTEHVSLDEAFWWAISTASTVGYSDVSSKSLVAHTLIGKFVTLVMIFLGIGVMGILTSTLTTYLVKRDSNKELLSDDDSIRLILKKLENLEQQNENLVRQNQEIQQELNNLKSAQNKGPEGIEKLEKWFKHRNPKK
ncbi:ion transporter [Lactobacillus sp. PV037]|uniref:ion channel n=1 Tax=Lactobacillus sp. PV037 TaxID=2594496 RepID=UPI00223F1E75|nr:ion channel [Lactobacillus sp. PV037]QNQ84087.1 ion transporter [Lactobacillus sp. PV037]